MSHNPYTNEQLHFSLNEMEMESSFDDDEEDEQDGRLLYSTTDSLNEPPISNENGDEMSAHSRRIFYTITEKSTNILKRSLSLSIIILRKLKIHKVCKSKNGGGNFSSRRIVMLSFLALGVMVFVEHISVAMSGMKVSDMENQHFASPLSVSEVGGFHEGGGNIPIKKNLPSSQYYHHPQEEEHKNSKHQNTIPKLNHHGEEEDVVDLYQLLSKQNYDISPYDDDISPYVDLRLNITHKERQDELNEWREKMEIIRKERGYWNFHDGYQKKKKKKFGKHVSSSSRPFVNFDMVEYRDLEGKNFPRGAWQTDPEYVKSFLQEALSLIHRVKEAIYDEYNLSSNTDQTSHHPLGIQFLEQPLSHTQPSQPAPSSSNTHNNDIAWMTNSSFYGLSKKILHAMITNDEFHVVMAGNSSAAAGHGNNFVQGYMMQFHEIMEPVFDRLGMTLITRNMAQGGVDIMKSTLAGGGVYGESDLLLLDNDGDVNGKDCDGATDAFHRQAILSGKRIPILFGRDNACLSSLHEQTGVHVGGFTMVGTTQNDDEEYHLLDQTLNDEQMKTLPYALRGLFCTKDNESLCRAHKYTAKCWIDRTDVSSPPKSQLKTFPNQIENHPGDKSHKWKSRKISIIVLLALEHALHVWEEGLRATNTESHPHLLPDRYWHVTNDYNSIRDNLLQSSTDNNKSPCETYMQHVSPRVCHVPMKGYTEYTPRTNPQYTAIRSIVRASPPDNYVPFHKVENMYHGPEPKIPSQKVPKGEVDIYAIASVMAKGKKIKKRRTLQTQSPPRQLVKDQNADITKTDNNNIIPGQGWDLIDYYTGYCDGTIYSECNRPFYSHCLMNGHNDGQGKLIGDGTSGWLVLDLQPVKEGIIMMAMDVEPKDSNIRTRNDGIEKELNHEEKEERTKPKLNGRKNVQKKEHKDDDEDDDSIPLPKGFLFDVSINGNITTWNREEFWERRRLLSDTFSVWVLLDDEQMFTTTTMETNNHVELAIKIRGVERDGVLSISHVYFA